MDCIMWCFECEIFHARWNHSIFFCWGPIFFILYRFLPVKRIRCLVDARERSQAECVKYMMCISAIRFSNCEIYEWHYNATRQQQQQQQYSNIKESACVCTAQVRWSLLSKVTKFFNNSAEAIKIYRHEQKPNANMMKWNEKEEEENKAIAAAAAATATVPKSKVEEQMKRLNFRSYYFV